MAVLHDIPSVPNCWSLYSILGCPKIKSSFQIQKPLTYWLSYYASTLFPRAFKNGVVWKLLFFNDVFEMMFP